mgnify:CR=1 FL=1
MVKLKTNYNYLNKIDKNVYKTNMLDKYSNRPDCLEEMCYADFATSYTSNKEVQIESENHLLTPYGQGIYKDSHELKSNHVTLAIAGEVVDHQLS